MRVRVMASLFYQPDERPEVLAMAMQQWCAIIGEIPGPLAAWAFDEWERTQTHRPSPAHIRQLASRRRNELAAAIPRPPEPERPELTEEGRARISEAFQELSVHLRGEPVQVKAMPGAEL